MLCRTETAPGESGLSTDPSGQMISSGRKMPSLTDNSGLTIAFTAKTTEALVLAHGTFKAPRT